MKLDKYKFKTRLGFGFSIIILLNAISIGVSIKSINNSKEIISEIYTHPFAVSNAVRDINTNINAMHRTMKDVVLAENSDQRKSETNLLAKYDSTIMTAFDLVFDRFLGDLNDVHKTFNLYSNWENIRDSVFTLAKAGKEKEALAITRGIGAEHVKELIEHTRILINFADNKANEFYHISLKQEKKSRLILISLLLLVLTLSALIALIISNSISVPIKKLVAKIQSNNIFNLDKDTDLNRLSEQEHLEHTINLLEENRLKLKDFNNKLNKRVQERTLELEKNQELLNLTGKIAKVGGWEIDLKKQSLSWTNETYIIHEVENGLKPSVEEAINFYDETSKPIIGKAVNDALVNHKPFNLDLGIITAKGNNIAVNAIGHVRKNINGEPTHVFGTFQDITERKKYEQKLKETNESLHDLVYVASHDLQVPLVSMEGFVSELLDDSTDKLDEDSLYNLKRLQANARRMHKLVLSLLDVSRLNTQFYDWEEFNLNASIDKIIKDISLTIEKAGTQISIGSLPNIKADKLRIESVLRNLIVNSIVYCGKQISITISGNTVFVIDDGIGIPTDQLEKIFEPGERLKMIKTEGVGMGLTFCKKVMEQHGSHIWAESDGTNGTTMKIKFDPKVIIRNR